MGRDALRFSKYSTSLRLRPSPLNQDDLAESCSSGRTDSQTASTTPSGAFTLKTRIHRSAKSLHLYKPHGLTFQDVMDGLDAMDLGTGEQWLFE